MPLSEAQRAVVLRMLRADDVCEKSHRDGERWAHVHADTVHGYAQVLVPAVRESIAAARADAGQGLRVAALADALTEYASVWHRRHHDHASASEACTMDWCKETQALILAATPEPAPVADGTVEPDLMCGHLVGTFGHIDGCPDDFQPPPRDITPTPPTDGAA